MRAWARRATGDPAGAHDALCAALHVDGETADIYNDRGRVSMESGDFAGACADFERAARLRPHWSQPHSNRGWALVLAGEPDPAPRAFFGGVGRRTLRAPSPSLRHAARHP